MKKFIFAALLLPMACSVSFAQEEEGHSDVEFGYDDYTSPTVIIIESDELTDDGIQIAEGEFEELFPGDAPVANNPGFITIATEDEGGERVNNGDEVTVRFLDASQHSDAGVGFVNYYDAGTDEITSTGQITIVGQSGETSVLNGGSLGNGIDAVLLGIGSDGTTQSNSPEDPPETLPIGEIHNHLVFTLNSGGTGAYGMLFQFESVPADGGPIVTSAPVWLILNNGLDETVFEDEAVAKFVTPFTLGDVTGDGLVNFLDINAFIAVLAAGGFQEEADMDRNGAVNFLDINPFIQALTGQ